MRWRAGVMAALVAATCGMAAATPLRAASDPALSAPAACASADKLLDKQGDLKGAITAYQKVLAAASDSLCGKAGLEAATDLQAAETLHGKHLDGDAADSVKAAIKARPQTPIPAGLPAAVDTTPWWQTAPFVHAWEAFLGLLALIATLLVLWSIGRSFWRLLHGGNVQVSGANDPDAPAGSAGSGPGFALVLRNALLGLSTGSGHTSIDMVDPSNSAVSVPSELTDLVPQSKVLAAVLELGARLFTWRDLTVSVFLQCDSPQGPGLSMTVNRTQGGELVRSASLWAGDFGTRPPVAGEPLQKSLYPLALPAAVWAMAAARPVEFAALGTRNWRSYAIFQQGSIAQTQGQVDRARTAYQHALGIDPRNLAALTNLGILELRAID